MGTDLKDTIDNRMLYEAYAIQWIENPYTTNKEEFITKLNGIVRDLMSLSLENANISEDLIKDKDLTDITYYLNDRLYDLKHRKNEEDK
jgi:hypothetical protein